ncbi:MAG: butyrate kinase [Clostridia bacterium]|nr:butyrate kinase [Clostridia bacterium]
MKLLIINPGSTSTKISVFDEYTELFEESVFHDAPVLMQFPHVNGQVPFRKEVIIDILKKHGLEPKDIDVYVGRGGAAHPQHTGVTYIDDTLYNDTLNGVGGSEHPAKLGVLLAYEMCREFGGQMYTLNPTNVDELNDYARITGIKGVYANAQAHVLNQKAIAEKHAETMGRKYEDCNFIVAHIDGGITVHAHDHGRMTDGNVGAGGDGAFTPTRIGSVPVLALLDYIEAHSIQEVRNMCSRSGGFVSYFGTSDAKVVHRLVEGNDPKAVLIWNAMIYQICKQVGAMSAVLEGKVDGILLTGGLVRYNDIIEGIRRRCGWIAPITVYPGEMEQHAMAYSVLKVLHGETEAIRYSGRPVWEGFSFID